MSDIKWFINNWDYFYFKDAPAHLSGVSLDKSEITLTAVWQTEQLTATIIPANPVETVSLNWSSSDTSIATVDNTWLVTCVTPWECTITVTTTPWSYTASCSVISGWLPWDNTIAYFPFENDILDVTWNVTLSWTMVKDWLWYKPTASTNWTLPSECDRLSAWMKINTYPTSWNVAINVDNLSMWYYSRHNEARLNRYIYVFTSSSFAMLWKLFSPNTWEWHHIWVWWNGTKSICSIDWVVYDLWSTKWYNFGSNFGLAAADIDYGDVILETVCWDSTQIEDYYNQTKSKYWIS